MKPIHTLTWAVSAPILLFAGASHAELVSSLTDPACTGTFRFDSAENKIMCDKTVVASAPVCSVVAPDSAVTGSPITIKASCAPAATSYDWTATNGAKPIGESYAMTFTAAGDYFYTVQGTNSDGIGPVSGSKKIVVTTSGGGGVSACGDGYVIPKGTNIINIGSIDYYAKEDFNSVFKNDGSTFASVIGDTEIKALEFINTSSAWGYISLLQGTQGGSGYKDISISKCPGDFNPNLGLACMREGVLSATNVYYSTNGSKGCNISVPSGTPLYVNIRATPGKAGSGFLLQNVVKTPM